MTTDRVSSGRIKVQRAYEHIEHLDAEIRAFRNLYPYVLIGKLKKETGLIHYTARVRESMPPMLGAIAADAIHNLRSSLDILWRTSTNPWPGRRDRRRGAFFPFAPADVLEARFRRAKEPRLKTAMGLAKFLRPYQGGNDPLWLLHEAEDIDKHEMPVLVAAATGTAATEASIGGPVFRVVSRHFTDAPIIAIEDGAELFDPTPPSVTPVDMEMEIAFEVAFGEFGSLKGRLLLESLNDFTGAVETVFHAFEAASLV